jgi:hypothetical protein
MVGCYFPPRRTNITCAKMILWPGTLYKFGSFDIRQPSASRAIETAARPRPPQSTRSARDGTLNRPRGCWRLQLLRGLGHDEQDDKQVFAGDSCPGGADGSGSRKRAQLALASGAVDRREDRVFGSHAGMGAEVRAGPQCIIGTQISGRHRLIRGGAGSAVDLGWSLGRFDSGPGARVNGHMNRASPPCMRQSQRESGYSSCRDPRWHQISALVPGDETLENANCRKL